MGGSAGFLSMEVKLDIQGAQAQLQSLAKSASVAMDKPLEIDAGAYGEMAKAINDLEKTYAQVLRISTQINQSTKNVAAASRDVAKAAREANQQSAKGLQDAKAEERVLREQLRLEQEKVKAAGRVDAANARAQGGVAVVQAQAQAAAALDQQKAATKEIARQTRAAAEETARLAKEQRQAASATQHTAKEASALKSAMGGMGKSGGWLLTAGGAAESRNFGYALSSLFQAAKSLWGALAALPPQAKLVAVAMIAATAAVTGFAIAVGGAAVAVAKVGTKGAIEFETLVNQLNAMMPTAEMAKKEIEGIFELGTTTIAPTSALIELDRRLIMAGGSAAQMRQQVVEGFASFSTAAGLTTEQMNSMLYLIGEVTLKGRLMRTEMSQQFSSAGLSSAGFLEATAEATGKSVDELNQKLTEGTFNAELFITGLTAYFAQFQGAAAASLTAVQALVANTKDMIQSSFSRAFYNAGVTSAISKILLLVQDLVRRIQPYLSVIAERVNEFFTAIGEALGSIANGSSGRAVEYLFAVLIPGAIRVATAVVKVFAGVFRLIVEIVKMGLKTVGAVLSAFGTGAGKSINVLKGIAAGLLMLVSPLVVAAAAVRVLIALLMTAISFVQMVFWALTGQFGKAASAFYRGIGHIGQGVEDVAGMFSSFGDIVDDTMDSLENFGKAKAPNLKDTGATSPAGGGAGAKKGKGKGGGGSASKAASELASALNELWDQTRRWLGLRSELEQSLMGGLDGFKASADQILDTGIRLAQVLDRAGYGSKSKLVVWLKKQIMALAKLAKERERLQKVLEEQQRHLEELQQERSAMAANVSQSMTDFVMALATEQETITEFTRLDSVGSFVVVERQNTKSWTQQMKDRLDATKKFVAGIRALKARGLNPETIRQLVEAGPEAAAAAIAELTAGGQETIDEVNGVQAEITDLAGEFGEEQAGAYYDAGIAATAALIKGTQADISKVEAAADAISKAIRDRLAGIAVPAKESGAAIGGSVAEGIGEGLEDGLAGAGAIDLTAWGGTAGASLGAGMMDGMGLTFDAEQVGRDIVGGLFDGIGKAISAVGNWIYTHIIAPVKGWLGISSPSTVFATIGGQIIAGLFNGITSAISGVGNWINTYLIQPVKTWLGISSPSTKFIEIGKNIISGLFDGITAALNPTTLLNKFTSAFASVIDWFGGKGKYSSTGFPSKVKSAIGGALNVVVPANVLSKLAGSVSGTVKNGINAVIRKWNELSFTFPSATGDWNGPLPGGKFAIGGWRMDTPNVPLLASGGVTVGPTMAMVGEAGAEAVLPLTDSRAMEQIASSIAGAGGPGSWQVRVFIGDQELTDLVRTEIAAVDTSKSLKMYARRG